MERTKTKIHSITIKRSGEKKLFQIKLPINAKKITGIQVTIQPYGISEQERTRSEYLFPISKSI